MNSYLDELLFRKLNAMCASYFDLNPIRNVLSGTETVVIVSFLSTSSVFLTLPFMHVSNDIKTSGKCISSDGDISPSPTKNMFTLKEKLECYLYFSKIYFVPSATLV